MLMNAPQYVVNRHRNVGRDVMKRMTMFLLLASLAIAIPRASTAQSAHFASVDIRDFVRQVFFEGVPYSEASRFESSVVPTLLQMLADPREEDHWSNIAVVLEIIGDEGAVDPLIQFIEEGSPGIMSRSEYVARTSALMGLGYLVNGTGNKKALNYLKQSVAPEMWEARFKGIAPYQVSVQERNEDLSTYAILGLALSGHPSAAGTSALASKARPLRIGNGLSSSDKRYSHRSARRA